MPEPWRRRQGVARRAGIILIIEIIEIIVLFGIFALLLFLCLLELCSKVRVDLGHIRVDKRAAIA